MTVDIEMLKSQNIEDTKILLNLLQDVDCSKKNIIFEIEKQAYEVLRNNPNDLSALLIVAITQAMLGNNQKAQAVVMRIWERKPVFAVKEEVAYINLMLNVAMLDMASVVLKDKIENMDESIEEYKDVMMKFALLTGNISLIDRITDYTPEGDILDELYDFAETYREEKYEQHYKTMQKIIVDGTKNVVCAYEFEIYTDRGFTDLEMVVYVNHDIDDVDVLFDEMESRVDKYFAALKEERIFNLTYTYAKIDRHPSFKALSWKG